MIRIRIAVGLLKWAGALVEYRVKRIRARAPESSKHVDGSTIYRVKNLSLARDRFRKARCGDGETISVQIVARVLERHNVTQGSASSVVRKIAQASGAASMGSVNATGDSEQADGERSDS